MVGLFMLAETVVEKNIEQMISPSIDQMGYEVVRVRLIGGGNKTLQIMLDRKDSENIDVDDCARASYQISAILDVEDPINENYSLEVSSPGLDRPLTRLKDFDKYKGDEVKIELFDRIGDRRKFKGLLKGLDSQDKVVLEVQDQEGGDVVDVIVEFDEIKSAKLTLEGQMDGGLNNLNLNEE